jgi:hypothetical protein
MKKRIIRKTAIREKTKMNENMDSNGRKKNPPIILIAGDVCADWLLFQTGKSGMLSKRNGNERLNNWQSEKQVFIPAVHGGAWIVERFIRMVLDQEHCKNIYSYKRFSHSDLRAGDSRYVINQFTDLKTYPLSMNNSNGISVYRVIPGSYRFSGPTDNSNQLHPYLLPLGLNLKVQSLQSFNTSGVQKNGSVDDFKKHLRKIKEKANYFPTNNEKRIIVIYDRGNGFNSHKYHHSYKTNTATNSIKIDGSFGWEYLFHSPNEKSGRKSSGLLTEDEKKKIHHVILSLQDIPNYEDDDAPLKKNPILDFLEENNLFEKVTIILDANDLRSRGAYITRGASWERTAEETLKVIQENPFMIRISKAQKIVVRFGISGALIRLQTNGLSSASIICDPTCNEQGYGDTERQGTMYPMDAIMTAVITANVYNRLLESDDGSLPPPHMCINAVEMGLRVCRSYFDRGINLKLLSRESIEKWDMDFEGHSETEEEAGAIETDNRHKEKRASVLGYYEDFGWKENVFNLVSDIYMNDEHDFGKLFTDPEIAIQVCRYVADEVFAKNVQSEFETIFRGTDFISSGGIKVLFVPVLYEGRSSRILVRLSVTVDPLQFGDIGKHLCLLRTRQLPYEAFRTLGETKDLRKQSEVKMVLKTLFFDIVKKSHQKASENCYSKFFSPFTLLTNYKGQFCTYNLDKQSENVLNFLPTAENELFRIAVDIVLNGFERISENRTEIIPYAKFGEMTVVDKQEIETFRSMNLLMRNYLLKDNVERPLCAAVFGPPGSGKSFGVKQLAFSCGIRREDMLEYNLSQFESQEDLERALINCRNACSPNRTPLVFFDEFDSTHNGNPLGWLKMFLSAMQDGSFSFGGDLMRLGKSILIFAGGTAHSFSAFTEGLPGYKFDQDYFGKVKGPDFVSRLRGYIDIAGVNPIDDLNEDSPFHYVRRAALIRSIIQREYPFLIGSVNKAKIDPGVLNALIRVSRYTHGARSLAAIFDMSNLSAKNSFERSLLPSAQQLSMHLKSSSTHNGVDEFLDLLIPRQS